VQLNTMLKLKKQALCMMDDIHVYTLFYFKI